MSGGAIVSAPAPFAAVMAIGRDRSVWTGAASELRFYVQAADGGSLQLQGINHVPEEHSISLFNAYWGPELSLGTDGCVAVFLPSDGSPRAPDYFGCGALTHVGLPAAGYALVARGAAAEWLAARAGAPFAVNDSFPLPNTEFMVGGSHALIQGGTATALPADAQHPRSLIGVDAGGFLYLVAVDGRSEDSGGMSLPELQAYAASLGLANAMNLDGGGSTTLVVKGAVVNRPSDGFERAVAGVVEVGPAQPTCRHTFVRC